MSDEFIINLMRDTLYTVMLVSAPMLIAGLIIGLIISVFQATTQIHEMTLTFVPKVIAMAVVGILTLPWMIHVIVTFSRNLINQIPQLVK